MVLHRVHPPSALVRPRTGRSLRRRRLGAAASTAAGPGAAASDPPAAPQLQPHPQLQQQQQQQPQPPAHAASGGGRRQQQNVAHYSVIAGVGKGTRGARERQLWPRDRGQERLLTGRALPTRRADIRRVPAGAGTRFADIGRSVEVPGVTTPPGSVSPTLFNGERESEMVSPGLALRRIAGTIPHGAGGRGVQCNHNLESVIVRTAGTDALGAARPDVQHKTHPQLGRSRNRTDRQSRSYRSGC